MDMNGISWVFMDINDSMDLFNGYQSSNLPYGSVMGVFTPGLPTTRKINGSNVWGPPNAMFVGSQKPI